MQYYDLLSSEQRERILTEQLLDRMEEAEELQNSGPTGYARHDDDDDDDYDYEEQRRREEEREREELERSRHKPYGHRFRSKEEPRRVGYGRRRDNNHDNNTYHKPYARKSAHSRSNSSDSYDNNQNNKNTLHKSYACRSARRDHNKPVSSYGKGRPSYKTRRPPR